MIENIGRRVFTVFSFTLARVCFFKMLKIKYVRQNLGNILINRLCAVKRSEINKNVKVYKHMTVLVGKIV